MRRTPRHRGVDDPGSDFLISSISVWEIALKVRKGIMDLGFPVSELVRRLRRRGNVEIVPVDVEAWLGSVELPWEHRDPADRTIVAMARLHGVPIVTCDTHISAFYADIVW